METKVCKTCKEEKLIEYFTRYDSGNGTGWRAECKECLKIKGRIYREKNKERLSSKQKEWRKNNEDHIKEYRDKNKERERQRNKKRWAENKKELKIKISIWRKENAEHIKEYRRNNRDRDRESARKWYKTERGNALSRTTTHRYRAKKKSVASDLTAEQWLQIKNDFNESCAYCGAVNVTLHQEHFVPVSKGGPLSKTNILPSCQPCNNRKSAKDFFEWYRNDNCYSVENERRIVEYLNSKGANIKYEL